MKNTPKLPLWTHVLDTLGWRNLALIGFGFAMIIEVIVETIEYANEQTPLQNMLDDLLSLVVGLVLISVVSVEAWRTRSALAALQNRSEHPAFSAAGDDRKARAAARDYGQVVERHFERWQMTPSEREIAVALLKGLSFQEIALLRDTREKTVRQHASSVYRKSGLAGRHELAAWFFEDLLSQE